jgi:CIC family chloride channel protein
MEAVALKGGRIRPRVAIVKSLASALCIGSGGSVGREGPIVQIGSSAGSSVGQLLRLPEDSIKTLIACGAAGGVSATFNAPIAGVLFAMEVILGRVVTRRFAYVVVSSVIADIISRAFLGNIPAFTLPQFGIVSPWEFIFFAALGILASLTAIFFTKFLYWSEDLFNAIKMPEYLKPALGGLFIGLIGFYLPDIFGVGYGGIDKALSGNLTAITLLSLFGFKILATSLTIASGGSGGVFAPSLFIGAMLGALTGGFFAQLFPDITAPAGAYGIAGMAAVFAGAARAPFSAIIIIYEMTGNYSIILPVMTSVVISTLLARNLMHANIYTLKLLRRGVDIEQEEVSDIMRTITVGETMTRKPPTVPSDMPVKDFIQMSRKTSYHGFPVINNKDELVGMVTLSDIEKFIGQEENGLTIDDVATKSLFVAYPDQSLDKVLKGASDEYGYIPVVNRENAGELLGILRRRDVIKAYRNKVNKNIKN